LLLMSKLAFSSVFARDGRQRMFYHMKANGQTPQARCVIVAFLSFSLGAQNSEVLRKRKTIRV
jgi:hypothetical protein